MTWENLHSIADLETAHEHSFNEPVLLFKHSTRCGISKMALGRVEKDWEIIKNGCKPFLIDLLNFREVSNEVVNKYGITHESPQAVVLKNGEIVGYANHGEINITEISQLIKN